MRLSGSLLNSDRPQAHDSPLRPGAGAALATLPKATSLPTLPGGNTNLGEGGEMLLLLHARHPEQVRDSLRVVHLGRSTCHAISGRGGTSTRIRTHLHGLATQPARRRRHSVQSGRRIPRHPGRRRRRRWRNAAPSPRATPSAGPRLPALNSTNARPSQSPRLEQKQNFRAKRKSRAKNKILVRIRIRYLPHPKLRGSHYANITSKTV